MEYRHRRRMGNRPAIDDLSTTRDLVYDALRMVETIRPASVVLENVQGFANSGEGLLFKLKLRKWGYDVTDAVLNAGDFGGNTGRERYYLVASVFPGFKLPTPAANTEPRPLWEKIRPYLDECREISHTKALHDGLTSGRARLITRGSELSPTILKSQARQAKDSVYIDTGDGRYLLPSLRLLRFLNGIPEDLHLDNVSAELACEIVGQSIEYPMHKQLMRALYAHIGENVGPHAVVTISNNTHNAQE